ncbi:Pkinase-domain-containing protein [Lizonia empirigonia]|nr:Pkinase-domain-containing protein [Lizonia empirigonia]
MATPAAVTPQNGLQRRFKGCSKIGEYEMLQKLGEGTFGEVHKARQRSTGSVFALKKILMHNEKDGFPITALREIKLLKMLCHDNVLRLEEMAVERPRAEGRKRAILYMVTPYMDHDLSGLLDNPDVKFQEAQIKCYMLQLFKGLQYLHDNHILHRDMKAANLLINNRGRLQIADFGLARHYDEPVPQRGKGNGEARREYTTLVVTRWYRPPELLLQLRRYTPAIDMWGAGCVFGEMFKRKPILAGQSDLHQAQIIFELVGSPNDQTMPGWHELPGAEPIRGFPPSNGTMAQRFRELSPTGLSLIKDLMRLDWRRRINAIDAIDHPYFKENPKPMREEDIPTFADSHELDRRNARGRSRRCHQLLQVEQSVSGQTANGPGQDHRQIHGATETDGMAVLRIVDLLASIDHEATTTGGRLDTTTDRPHLHHPRVADDQIGVTAAISLHHRVRADTHFPSRHATDLTAAIEGEISPHRAILISRLTKVESDRVDHVNLMTANDEDPETRAIREKATQTSGQTAADRTATTDDPATRERSHETAETGGRDRVVRIAGVTGRRGTAETTGRETMTFTDGGRTAIPESP